MITTKKRLPSYLGFDHRSYAWSKEVDYRAQPETYRVGKGEQGVLICEPYKSEIGKYWRFKNRDVAFISAKKIFTLFNQYIKNEDFVGADMARKYLQMGFTRARRYANYEGGNKYDKLNNYSLKQRGTGEQEKAEAAEIFFAYWKQAENNFIYAFVKEGWKMLYG